MAGHLTRKSLKWLLLGTLLAAPVGVWSFYKPVRMLAPQLVGFTRVAGDAWVDDPSRAAEVAALYAEALEFVNVSVGRIEHRPRVVFCATISSYHRFGLDKPSARTTPFGIVVGPRAWQAHYVRHEMIHHLQRERLGALSLGPVRRWRSPEWFIEGMAYTLSEDPRPVLAGPNQEYRRRFREWYRSVGKERLWSASPER